MEVLDFNNIEEFEYKKVSNNHYKFKSNNDIVDVHFDEFDFDNQMFKVLPLIEPFNGRRLINVGYKFNNVETQSKKTNIRELLPVLKTVVKIIESYIKNNNPELISIFATGRESEMGSDATKLKIYDLMITKHRPTNYGVSKINLDGDSGILLYNTKTLNLLRRKKL